IGMGILIVQQRAWQIATALSLVMVATLGLSVRLGSSWPADYLSTMSNYTVSAAIPQYRDAISIHTMNVFRHSFQGILGEEAARRISLALFASGVLAWLIAAYVSVGRHPLEEGRARALICASIALFILFAPYSGAYEDLLVVFALVLVASTRDAPVPSLTNALAFGGAL